MCVVIYKLFLRRKFSEKCYFHETRTGKQLLMKEINPSLSVQTLKKHKRYIAVLGNDRFAKRQQSFTQISRFSELTFSLANFSLLNVWNFGNNKLHKLNSFQQSRALFVGLNKQFRLFIL